LLLPVVLPVTSGVASLLAAAAAPVLLAKWGLLGWLGTPLHGYPNSKIRFMPNREPAKAIGAPAAISGSQNGV